MPSETETVLPSGRIGGKKMTDLPIDVKAFEFSDVDEFVKNFEVWRLRGRTRKLTIIATNQSSWWQDGQVKHLVTILYTQGEYPSQ